MSVRLGGVWGLRRFTGLLKGSIAAGVGSVGLGAYLTVGMLLEREATGLHAGIELSGIADPGWLQVFSWSNFRFWLLPTGVHHWYGGYVGLSLTVLAVGSLVVLVRSRGSWRYEPLVPAWLGAGAGLWLSLVGA